jgi:hypothetical protein
MRLSSATLPQSAIRSSSNPVNRKPHLIGLLRSGFIIMVVTIFFAACDQDVVREAGAYGDGARAYEREYRVTSDAGRVPHGAHATWYAGGERRTLEFYRNGVREGYAFEWNEAGALMRLQACEAGVCEERSVSERAQSGVTMVASHTSE